MPRNRTVRLAVLGSSVQRPAAPRFPARSRSALTRRIVVGALVLLSFALITVSFRADGVTAGQETGAAVLRPFQVGIARVAQPFRDLYGWFSGLVDAKSEVERLQRELVAARQEAIQYRAAAAENEQLREIAGYRAPASYPSGFGSIAAAVIAHPGPFEQELTISAGSNDGVGENAPVITPDGLVGIVTEVTDVTAKVTLLTDGSSAVGAEDVNTGARGLVKAGRAGSDVLVLDNVRKDAVVRRGDKIISAGSERGKAPSLYPRSIPIGIVTYVNQSDIDYYKRVQVKPFVDFDTVESVIVLVPEPTAR